MVNNNSLGSAVAGLPASPIDNGAVTGFDEAPQTPVPSASAKLSAASITTPVGRTTLDPSQLSPMHPARPTLRSEDEAAEISDGVDGQGPSKLVDVIFSPMLKFLGGAEGEEDEKGAERSELEGLAEIDGVGDGKLETTQKTMDEKDEEDAVEHPIINEEIVPDVPQDEQEDAVIGEADDGSSQGSDVDDEEEFNPYAFIKSLPAYEEVKSFCPPDRLPAKDEDSPPISLVLDLDETLVHCTVEAVDDADLTFPVEFHGMTYQVYVRLRPHLNEFLEAISDKFEVIVFTASQQVYADALLNLIDPENKYIKHRMFRESCLSVEGNFLKDLNVLGRDLKKSVLVDNSPHAFGYQVDNGIPIESWFDDRDDTELLKLERFLRTLHGVKDVRTVVRRSFQTYRLIANAP